MSLSFDFKANHSRIMLNNIHNDKRSCCWARATKAGICTHCINTNWARFRFLGKPTVAPCRLGGSAPHKSGGRQVKSWPHHTNKHTPVIWICDLCHEQINLKQTSIRCNHTHNTHWVNLKCTQIKHRQYKPDWRCTIHTPTQNVTTPSTDNTTAHHEQTITHPLTNNNQPKDKNIVIRQIHKRHQNQNRRTNNLVHSTQPDINTIQETKLTQKAKTQKYPTTPHNLHKHKHTEGHQYTQDRTTPDQNSHRQDQRHHSSKHILSTKRHDVATLQHRGHIHCIRHVTNIPDSILTCDMKAHSTISYSHTDDHRGHLISDIISNL